MIHYALGFKRHALAVYRDSQGGVLNIQQRGKRITAEKERVIIISWSCYVQHNTTPVRRYLSWIQVNTWS